MSGSRHFKLTVVRAGGRDLLWMIGVVLFVSLLVSFGLDGSGTNVTGDTSSADVAKERDWQKVIQQCITKVEQSDAVFYRRGERVTGKDVARQMREYLKIVQKVKSIPDPFGRNAGILLAVITTHEGVYRDGLTGRPEPFEVEVGERRIMVYDWLKQELGLEMLPGEEEGHEVSVSLYDPVVPQDLLRQWEEYLDRCIEVTKRAEDCRFYLAGRHFSGVEAGCIFASNRVKALQRLKEPDIKHRDEKELYNQRSILLALTRLPLPRPESFSDRAEYVQELDRQISLSWKRKVVYNGIQEDLIDWLLRKAGEPPSMPKLKKKGKGSG